MVVERAVKVLIGAVRVDTPGSLRCAALTHGPALLTASRTGVLRAGPAGGVSESLALLDLRTIVRPFPMIDFASPMVWLMLCRVAASSRLTVRWLVWRSSGVTAGGSGSCDLTVVSSWEAPSSTSRPRFTRSIPAVERSCSVPASGSVSVPGGAGMLCGEPMRAAALSMPSSIASRRSPVTVTGSCVGISRAGVGCSGGMLRS